MGSLLLFAVNGLTHSVSAILDSIVLGEYKMQALNAVMAGNDTSVSTMDMHLERSLVVMIILGLVLYVSSQKETEE